jgi:hypothetical protein
MPHFTSVSIRNVGPIQAFDAAFSPCGVNLIYGPNESGKTHVAAAMLASISQNPLSFFRPSWDRKSNFDGEKVPFVQVGVQDASGKGIFRILPGNELSASSPGITLQDCPQAQQLREVRDAKPRSRWHWGQETIRPRRVAPDWHRLLSLLELHSATPNVVRFFRGVSQLPQAALPQGCMEAIALAEACLETLDHATPRPMIFDGTFGSLDPDRMKIVAEILRVVSLRHQVILFTAHTDLRGSLSCTTANNIERQSPGPLNSGLSLAGSLEELIEAASASLPEPRSTPENTADAIVRSAAPYLRSLGLPAVTDDRDAYESIVDDLACSSTAAALGAINAQLLQTLGQEIERLLGPIWNRLHPLTKEHLTVGRFLASLDGDQFLRLAVLVICIGIETEIRDKIFSPFVQLVRKDNRKYPEAASPSMPAKPTESYDYLRKLIGGDIPHVSLGAFPWILKAARQYRETTLFADLMNFIDDRYGISAAHICYLVESIAFRTKQSEDRIMGRILDIRNACAHGRTDAFESATARELLDHIWGFAFREPLELLRKLASARSNPAA